MKKRILILYGLLLTNPAMHSMEQRMRPEGAAAAQSKDSTIEEDLRDISAGLTTLTIHLSNHGSISSKITSKTTAARVAQRITCPACIADFIDKHPDAINTISDGYTPAQWAAIHGNEPFLEALLTAEADIAIPIGTTGDTLLTYTIKTSKSDSCIKLILLTFLLKDPTLIKTTVQQCATQNIPFDCLNFLMQIYTKQGKNTAITLPTFGTIMSMLYTPEPSVPTNPPVLPAADQPKSPTDATDERRTPPPVPSTESVDGCEGWTNVNRAPTITPRHNVKPDPHGDV